MALFTVVMLPVDAVLVIFGIMGLVHMIEESRVSRRRVREIAALTWRLEREPTGPLALRRYKAWERTNHPPITERSLNDFYDVARAALRLMLDEAREEVRTLRGRNQ